MKSLVGSGEAAVKPQECAAVISQLDLLAEGSNPAGSALSCSVGVVRAQEL